MDPATATIIATALAEAAKATGSAIAGSKAKKIKRKQAKETKRETIAQLLSDAMKRDAELESHRLGNRAHRAKRSAENRLNTSEIVRGSLTP